MTLEVTNNLPPSSCSPKSADTMIFNIQSSGYSVYIGQVRDQLQGHIASVPVYLDSTLFNGNVDHNLIGGFNFLFGFDNSALTLVDCNRGELIDEVKFEYFIYQYYNCDGDCPSGLVNVFAAREINDGIDNEYHLTDPGELFKLNFLITDEYNLECQFLPILFYWRDCWDNVITNEFGNIYNLEHSNYSFLGNEIIDPNYFGYTGPADSCFSNYPDYRRLRSVIYHNGGIKVICKVVIDDRGDLNMNGIPYEIADIIIYSQYFCLGPEAFTISYEGQAAQSDVNNDGIELTPADFVYLARILVGDALPNQSPPVPYGNINFINTALGGIGSLSIVSDSIEIGAFYLEFSKGIDVQFQPSLDTISHCVSISNDITRIFMFIRQDVPIPIENGDFVTYSFTGDPPELVEAHFCDIEGVPINVNIINNTTLDVDEDNSIIPDRFHLYQNYPNPFNPITSISFDLPHRSDWRCEIFNISGQTIKAINGVNTAGNVSIQWNGTDETGKNVASGIYFYRVAAGQFEATRKMILLK